MAKTAWIITFKLKKNVAQEDFIKATQTLHDEVFLKAKGFISWEQFLEGDVWTDFILWESLEDATNGVEIGHGTSQAKAFYAFLQMNTCKMMISSSVKKY